MKRAAQPNLSVEGQQALDQYAYVIQKIEDLTAVTIRNYLSDLRQFMAWCEYSWHEEWNEAPSFTPPAITLPLLIYYRTYLQATLWLKASSINRAIMSLKRYFAWTTKMQVIQQDPTSTVKFVPKESTAPRHLDDDEEGALIAVVNDLGALRDRTMITLVLHTGLQGRERCALMRQQMYVGKQNGTLRIIGIRHKVHDVPLSATARSILSVYLEMLPKESIYLFPSEKMQEALEEQALGHLITKYARLVHLVDVSPHDLRYRLGYWMARVVPLHSLVHLMGYDSLDTTMLYIRGTKQGLYLDVEKIAWI